MKKKRMTFLSLGLSALLIVFVLVMAQGNARKEGSIVLPEMPADTAGTESGESQSPINLVEITPATVQAAVATLNRPNIYQRAQTVEIFWSGGSGRSVSQVAVNGEMTRIDTVLVDGSTLHMLTWGDRAAQWYDEETDWTGFRSEEFTSDIAQRMLSYETVLDLPTESILLADYRVEEGVYCIYVETSADEEGYAQRFWISTASGLLYKAERWQGQERIYAFTAPEPGMELPENDLFLLPDGTEPAMN